MKRFLSALLFVSMSVTAAVKAPKPDVAVKVFANTAIVSVYDFSYKNIVSSHKQAAVYFSGTGWIALTKAFQSADLLGTVVKHRYEVSAVATRPPKITDKGLKDSGYQWQVDMPIMVVFKNDDYQQVQYLDVTATVGFLKGVLRVEQLLAVPGKALPCEQTSSNLVVKAQPSDKKDDKKAGDKKMGKDKADSKATAGDDKKAATDSQAKPDANATPSPKTPAVKPDANATPSPKTSDVQAPATTDNKAAPVAPEAKPADKAPSTGADSPFDGEEKNPS